MPALEITHLYLLSAMMQTLGALWGIVFVVYVFLYEYYSRSGGWEDNAGSTIDEINRSVKAAPEEMRAYPSGRTYPSVTGRLREELDSVPLVRRALGRYRRVFWLVFLSGPIVLLSILTDAIVILRNESLWVPVAVTFFVVALIWLGVVLLNEVGGGIKFNRRLIMELRDAEIAGRKSYDQVKETIPEE